MEPTFLFHRSRPFDFGSSAGVIRALLLTFSLSFISESVAAYRLAGSRSSPRTTPPSPSTLRSTTRSAKVRSSSCCASSACSTRTRSRSASALSATPTRQELDHQHAQEEEGLQRRPPSQARPRCGSTSRSCAASTSSTVPVSCPSLHTIPRPARCSRVWFGLRTSRRPPSTSQRFCRVSSPSTSVAPTIWTSGATRRTSSARSPSAWASCSRAASRISRRWPRWCSTTGSVARFRSSWHPHCQRMPSRARARPRPAQKS